MKVKLIAVALCLALGTTITQAQKPSNSKTQEEKVNNLKTNKMTVKEVVETYSIALSKGDIPTAFSYFSPDAKWHQPGNNKFSGTKSGLDADTVWYEGVQEAIDKHRPEIIIVNGGDNQFFNSGSLIMGKDDIYEVHKAAAKSKIIVSHMEAVNHYTLSRDELKGFIKEKGIASNVLVPDDGESYTL